MSILDKLVFYSMFTYTLLIHHVRLVIKGIDWRPKRGRIFSRASTFMLGGGGGLDLFFIMPGQMRAWVRDRFTFYGQVDRDFANGAHLFLAFCQWGATYFWQRQFLKNPRNPCFEYALGKNKTIF